MPSTDGPTQYQTLLRDGFCLWQEILDPNLLRRLCRISDQLLDGQTEADRQEQRSTGSMINLALHTDFAHLAAYPPVLAALASMGFDRPTWQGGYIISKPPHSPPLFWHQDWWGWNDPCSYQPPPQQVFLMYYLVDTSPHNGCLRLIPGSHLKRHPMHRQAEEAHTDTLRRVEDPDHPAFKPVPGEIDLAVKAGDLVIGDARLLHAAHANRSDQRRTVLTLWYHPRYYELPESIQARLAQTSQIRQWENQPYQIIKDLVPSYNGKTDPIEWNRIPGEQLR